MSEWQPIETAPRDIQLLAACIKHKSVFITRWDAVHSRFDGEHHCSGKPTHWMPLPPPPEKKP